MEVILLCFFFKRFVSTFAQASEWGKVSVFSMPLVGVIFSVLGCFSIFVARTYSETRNLGDGRGIEWQGGQRYIQPLSLRVHIGTHLASYVYLKYKKINTSVECSPIIWFTVRWARYRILFLLLFWFTLGFRFAHKGSVPIQLRGAKITGSTRFEQTVSVGSSFKLSGNKHMLLYLPKACPLLFLVNRSTEAYVINKTGTTRRTSLCG